MLNIKSFLLSLLLILIGFSSPSYAIDADGNEPEQYVFVDVFTNQKEITGGQTITLGIEQTIHPTWHTYWINPCLLYTSPSPRDRQKSRMPSSA